MRLNVIIGVLNVEENPFGLLPYILLLRVKPVFKFNLQTFWYVLLRYLSILWAQENLINVEILEVEGCFEVLVIIDLVNVV
jgi:hypothetical protein